MFTRLTLLAALALSAVAQAQSFPTKPVRLVLPFAPGGPIDNVARVFSPKLADRIGQPVLIENRAGAAGNIGAEAVQKSPGDGYTILYEVPGIVTNPYFFKGSPDPREFAAITQMFSSSLVMVSSNAFNATSVADVIERIKANPGKVSCASSGALPTVGCELLKAWTRTDMIMVLYKGNGPALQAVMAGEVNLVFDAASTSSVQAKAGRIKPIASTNERRGVGPFPDLPLARDTIPELYFDGWHGIFGPPTLTRELIQRLSREIAATVKQPDVAGPLGAQGYEIIGSTPEVLAEKVKSEFARYGKVLTQAGIKPD